MPPPRAASRSTSSGSDSATVSAPASRVSGAGADSTSSPTWASETGNAVTPAVASANCLVGGHLDAFDDRVGDLRGEEPDGAQGVIVAGDDVVDHGGIAVGVDNSDDRDAELAGFLDGDGFVVRIDDEERVGQAPHVLDAGEVGLQVLALALELDDFLLGEEVVAAVGGHIIQFLKALDRLLHRDPVGEQARPASAG